MDTPRRVVISSPGPPDRDPMSGPYAMRPPIWSRLLLAFWKRWSVGPLASVILVLMLFWSGSRFPAGDASWPSSAPSSSPTNDITVCIDRVPVSDEHPGGIAIRPIAPGASYGHGLAFYDYRRRGASEGHYVSILSISLSGDERKEVVRLYLKWLAGHKDRYWRNIAASIDPSGVPSSLSFHAGLIYRTLLTLVLGGLFVRSLAWTLPILSAVAASLQSVHVDPEERLRQKRRRLLAAGLCPKCKYNIIGLPDRRCPECNETWGRHELH